MNERHFDLLKLLVEYNTESPPARNTDPLQDEIQAFLEENGFEVQRRKMYDHDSIVVGVLKGKRSACAEVDIEWSCGCCECGRPAVLDVSAV